MTSKIILNLIVCFCFVYGCVFVSDAQVTIDGGSSSTSKSSYTVGIGSDRMIIVTVQDECGCSESVSSITWGQAVFHSLNGREVMV